MAKKIVGWILLALGVLLMLWAGWRSYEIFTGQREAPMLFQTEQVEQILNQPKEPSAEGELSQEQISQTIKEQLANILPSQSIAKTINLGSWSILVFIMIYLGSKIAGLGIKLLGLPKEKETT